jgi:hypothetical protein
VRLFVHDSRCTDVSSIQIVEKIDESAEWEELQIHQSAKTLASFLVFDKAGVERVLRRPFLILLCRQSACLQEYRGRPTSRTSTSPFIPLADLISVSLFSSISPMLHEV